MQIINFKENELLTTEKLKKSLNLFLDKDTLIINDTRGMIIPSVLPYIEFVGSYDQRILPILSNTNIIISNPFSQEIKKYYENFGLTHNLNIIQIENIKEITLAKIISQDEDLIKKLKENNFKKIVPFFVNDDMNELSKKLEIPLSVSKDIFEKANDKLLLKKFLIKSNLPTIDGDFTNDIEILKNYFNKKERYLFKDPLGVSGYGFWDNNENTFEELEKNYNNKELIIEKFIEKESSPSVQFFINEYKSEAIIFGITDQLLENGKIYLGNSSPSIYLKDKIGDELINQSIKIVDYIGNLGYSGFGGIDFIVDKEKIVYATEVNARFTGATYPCLTSMLLKGDLTSKWDFYNYEGEKEDTINYLNLKCINSNTQNGVFPLGIGGIEKFGKANLLEFK